VEETLDVLPAFLLNDDNKKNVQRLTFVVVWLAGRLRFGRREGWGENVV